MKNYKAYIIVGIAFIVIITWLGIALYKIREYNNDEGKITRDTVFITKIDTIRISKPIYIKHRVVDTLFIAIKDTLRINDTLYQTIPKTQKEYRKDGLYQAWVSGYAPALDSINIFQQTIYRNITNTVSKKQSKIGLGVMGGYGASVINGQVKLAPSVTIGVYYRIW